jgi:putative FmdB family regulatory protein
MPTYEYRCANGHEFEVIQSMADDPVTACPECGAAVERVFHPVAVHFKGSGFYSTDYAGKGKAEAGASRADSSSSDGSGGSKGGKDSGGDGKSKANGGEKKAKTSSGSDSD